MKITDKILDDTFKQLKQTYGGIKNDYFGLLYLQDELGLTLEEAATQLAFGGNDYGIDAFHIDRERHNLHLFQFKYSTSYEQFKPSLQRLIDSGLERVFGARSQDNLQNDILLQLKSRLVEEQSVIERVFIHFVFLGDPVKAEASTVLSKLREDLENKKYLLDHFFKRPEVDLMIKFVSAQTRRAGAVSHPTTTRVYPIRMETPLVGSGPQDEQMHIGFVPLQELHAMYIDMGKRFFDRNIRDSLGSDKAVNRSIAKAFRKVAIDGNPAAGFAFHHNGVTLSAEKLDEGEGVWKITEPRLLNGAQTIATFHQFLEDNKGNTRLGQSTALSEIRVLCKIITEASEDFVTAVTISNNRQNPVSPWNLHANDMIQLELQDQFREQLGIYYERQENAFANFTDDEMEEEGIKEYKAIKLLMLAKTYIVSDGDIDKMSDMREVFENDRLYGQVFHPDRPRADLRKVVLCYKAQFRLRRILREILDRGENKYAYIYKARNLLWALLCQAMLNDDAVDHFAENFGKDMIVSADYTSWMADLTSRRCRFLVSKVTEDSQYSKKMAEENYNFLRTKAVYDRCMEEARRKWRWEPQKLR